MHKGPNTVANSTPISTQKDKYLECHLDTWMAFILRRNIPHLDEIACQPRKHQIANAGDGELGDEKEE